MNEHPLSPTSVEEKPGGEKPQAERTMTVAEDPESLRSRLAAAEQQRDDHFALLQRTQADAENYQKRVQRDMIEQRRFAPAAFVGEVLPVLDNLQRALDAAKQQGEQSALVQGVALVQNQLLESLGRLGVTPINALGQPFDPNVHEAVRQEPRSDGTAGQVIEVLEPGYRLHDRVLRPAKVVVATSPTP